MLMWNEKEKTRMNSKKIVAEIDWNIDSNLRWNFTIRFISIYTRLLTGKYLDTFSSMLYLGGLEN